MGKKKSKPENQSDERIAVIDIGSNSVRMVVFKISWSPKHKGPHIEAVKNTKKICELGALNAKGNIPKDNRRKALEALDAFSRYLKKHKIDDIIAVATAAARNAENGNKFINKAEKTLGHKIEILSAEQEANMAAFGVIQAHYQAGEELPDEVGVVADLGGGSLELARIGCQSIKDGISLKLGTLVMESAQDSQAVIEKALAGLSSSYQSAQSLYVIGGSWRAVRKTWLAGQEALKDDQDSSLVSVSSKSLLNHLDHLLDMRCDPDDSGPEKKRKLPQKLDPQAAEIRENYPDLSVNRANKLLNSSRLLKELIHRTGAEKTVFVESGLREGLVYKHLCRSGLSRLAENRFKRLKQEAGNNNLAARQENKGPDASSTREKVQEKTAGKALTGQPDPFKKP